MICTGVDSKTPERVQLDDYNDYLLDDINEGIDVTMMIDTLGDTNTEDPVDGQKEYRKLTNAKSAKRRRRNVLDEPTRRRQSP